MMKRQPYPQYFLSTLFTIRSKIFSIAVLTIKVSYITFYNKIIWVSKNILKLSTLFLHKTTFLQGLATRCLGADKMTWAPRPSKSSYERASSNRKK